MNLRIAINDLFHHGKVKMSNNEKKVLYLQ